MKAITTVLFLLLGSIVFSQAICPSVRSLQFREFAKMAEPIKEKQCCESDQPEVQEKKLCLVPLKECKVQTLEVKPEPTNVVSEEASLEFEIYPNPAGSWLILESGEDNLLMSDIMITDVNGKIVIHKPEELISGVRIDISELATGNYVVSGLINKERVSKKLLVVNKG